MLKCREKDNHRVILSNFKKESLVCISLFILSNISVSDCCGIWLPPAISPTIFTCSQLYLPLLHLHPPDCCFKSLKDFVALKPHWSLVIRKPWLSLHLAFCLTHFSKFVLSWLWSNFVFGLFGLFLPAPRILMIIGNLLLHLHVDFFTLCVSDPGLYLDLSLDCGYWILDCVCACANRFVKTASHSYTSGKISHHPPMIRRRDTHLLITTLLFLFLLNHLASKPILFIQHCLKRNYLLTLLVSCVWWNPSALSLFGGSLTVHLQTPPVHISFLSNIKTWKSTLLVRIVLGSNTVQYCYVHGKWIHLCFRFWTKCKNLLGKAQNEQIKMSYTVYYLYHLLK